MKPSGGVPSPDPEARRAVPRRRSTARRAGREAAPDPAPGTESGETGADHASPGGAAVELESAAGPATPARIAASLRAADRLADARAVHAEILAGLSGRRHARARAGALTDAAETELLAGDLASAGRLLDEALASGAAPDPGRSSAAVHRAHLDLLLGHLVAGREAAAAGVAAAEGAGDGGMATAWLGVLGVAELLAGDPSVAAVHFTTVRDAALERGVREPGRVRVDADLVEALVAAGRLDEAQAALDGFRARGALARTPWVVAADARAEALVRVARGDPEAALRALTAAAATIESLPLALERGRCLLAWGAALRAAGRRNAARAALTAAREAFARLPSPPWEARAVAELARLRTRPAST